jgi:hypothetical protein
VAIYRAERSRRGVLVATLAFVAGLILGWSAGRITSPDLTAQLDELRTRAAPIDSALEVVRVEYPKLLEGSDDTGGTEPALRRVRSLFDELRPSLAALNPAGVEALAEDLDRLAELVADRAPAQEIERASIEVEATLDALLGVSAPIGPP